MASGVLLGLALLDLALLLLALVGGVVLLGWGTSLALRASGAGRLRGAWLVAFLVLPGVAHLLFSLTRPTLPRFRLLAAAVTLSLVSMVIVTGLLVVFLRAQEWR